MDEPVDMAETAAYQARGLAWNPLRDDVERLLEGAGVSRLKALYYGSNHCFLATLDGGPTGRSLAVYKPARGEYPLYDFPTGTLYRREVASWLVNKILGWKLIPPTVVADGKYGTGSLQLFIEGHDEAEVDVDELRRLALLDIVLNNADRKPEHLLVGDEGKLWGIDHGLTFHVQTKLRTVLWHFAGSEIPPGDLDDLARLATAIFGPSRDAQKLCDLITSRELRVLQDRLARLVETGCFPDPRYKAVPYRW